MIVHWGQLLATLVSACTLAAMAAAAWRPTAKRREQRKIDALKTAALLAKVEIRETVTEIVTEAVGQVKEATLAGFDEVKADVKDIRASQAKQELDLARQFGGNGGGIRQALNEHGQQIATLVGRFDQHMTETGSKR